MRGRKIKGQTKRGPNITLVKLNIQTHNGQLGSKMAKNKGNKGSKVEDANVVCQQKKETQKKKTTNEIARHQNELKQKWAQ